MNTEAVSRPSISIALATYNGEKHIGDQLRSLALQTWLPTELVVFDDRSTDRTVEIIRDFATTAPFRVIIHINEKQLGYRENFVTITNRCSCDLISFCDQDDLWEPFKLATISQCFMDEKVLLAYHNAAVIDATGLRQRRLYDGAIHQRNLAIRPFFSWNCSHGFTQTIRSGLAKFNDVWDQSLDHFSDERQAHDQWYFFLALTLGVVVFVDEELVQYRQHAANVVGVGEKPSLRSRIKGKLFRRVDRDRQGAAAAKQRATILETIAKRLPEDQAQRALRASALYRRLSDSLAKRDRLYSQDNLLRRLGLFAYLVGKGRYWIGNSWHLDWREVPRDVVKGIFFRNL